ncbi:MAG: RNA-binding protein [Bacteroidetes bacterium]|nr:MAG: RNA-binding protein [Bacteroidota bacterium]
MAVDIGNFNLLKVIREVSFGLYLDDGDQGILLPRRFVPPGAAIGDELNVFLYHDGEDRLIATTQQPLGKAGDMVKLRCVNATPHGAFLDNGLMKDLFVPTSKQLGRMRAGADYLVYVYVDEQSQRLTATEKFEYLLSNDALTVAVGDAVQLLVYRRTDIGYVVIINGQHTGVLHSNEIYRSIQVGDKFEGFIKNILEDNKIDVAAGKQGYTRVEDASEKVLRLLQTHGGFLPYHDKSDPEEIYAFFSMSKKTFKMTTGNLFKQKKIQFEEGGIRLL